MYFLYLREFFFKEEGWRHLLLIVMRQNNLPYFLNQAKISYYRTQPYYKYGYQVPCNYEESIELDEMHGNLQCRYLEY